MESSNKLIIKRYGNRRLYNSASKSYVKLVDIAGFIREGSEIQVIDSRSGEDITKLVLTQIILEEEKSKKDLLPLSFLYDLIRHQQGWFQEFFQRHIVRALENYLPTRGELLNQLRQSLDLRTASAGLLDRLLNRSDLDKTPVPSERDNGEGASSAASPADKETAPVENPEAKGADPEVRETAGFKQVLRKLKAMEERLQRIEKTRDNGTS